MSHIFYDLETSGIDTKNQILAACFIRTNELFEIEKIYNFRVALNPLEIPAESAISVNAVDITQHMLHHKNKFDDLITEEVFADKLNALLSKYLKSGSALIGYNSNKFDIKHLRKVLIKWGYSPYYNYNKFDMVDLYSHIKLLKLHTPKEFEGMPNLKLGSVYKQLTKKNASDMHVAESDVIHCIDIAKFLLKNFDWDIVKENDKVNNLPSLGLEPQDVIVRANPYTEKVTFDKYYVHDVTKKYIILEKADPKEDESNFISVKLDDFFIGKKIGKTKLKHIVSVDEHFKSFEKNGQKGVENFVYHIGFKDFDKLKEARQEDTLGPSLTHLDELKNSQIFTKLRPIQHTENGLVVDELSEEEKSFIFFHIQKYGIEENDVLENPQNLEKLQLLKEYKAAYRELFESLK